MTNNNLQSIKLGAPSSIEGGDAPNGELSVQFMGLCQSLTLKDGVGRCTKDGAMKTTARLFGQRLTEDVSEHDWYTKSEDEKQIHVDVRGNGNLTGEEIDSIFEIIKQHILTDDSYMEGNIESDGCYKDAVDAIVERFPKVSIEAAKYFVRFKDPEVLRVLLENGVGADGVIATEQLAAVTNIGKWFANNTNIKYFDEFKMFGLTTTPQESFYGCKNIESIKIPDTITSIGQSSFQMFAQTSGIFKIDFKNVTSFGHLAFAQCSIGHIYAPKLTSLPTNNIFFQASIVKLTTSNELVANDTGTALSAMKYYNKIDNGDGTRSYYFNPKVECEGQDYFVAMNILPQIEGTTEITKLILGSSNFGSCVCSMDMDYNIGGFVPKYRYMRPVKIPANANGVTFSKTIDGAHRIRIVGVKDGKAFLLNDSGKISTAQTTVGLYDYTQYSELYLFAQVDIVNLASDPGVSITYIY